MSSKVEPRKRIEITDDLREVVGQLFAQRDQLWHIMHEFEELTGHEIEFDDFCNQEVAGNITDDDVRYMLDHLLDQVGRRVQLRDDKGMVGTVTQTSRTKGLLVRWDKRKPSSNWCEPEMVEDAEEDGDKSNDQSQS